MTGIPLRYKGETRTVKVYRIPLDYLIYNKYNGRIGTDVLSYERQNGILDAEKDEDRTLIERFLYESKKERNETTLKSLQQNRQQRYGIVTADGTIVDGNRRAMLLNRLFHKHAELGYTYVLLTPYDILREDEPSINKKDFYESHERIRNAIENDTLRTYVNNYIGLAVRQYEEMQRGKRRWSIREKSIRKIEKDAFKELVREYPELYDYYIRLRETDVDKIRSQSLAELNEQIEKLCVASQNIISLFKNLNYQTNEQLTAREEAKARLRFFKHIIEDCDGYKNLYTDGKQIAKENDLQRLFRFVWYGTSYKVDAEPNNGRGQADFIVSKGQNNQNIVEFKLASNSTLSHVFTQVKIYEAANCTDGSLIAIFCFSESEYLYSEQIVKAAGYEELLGESIYLIDCRNDNKKSASIA
jgi:hypothetical protein